MLIVENPTDGSANDRRWRYQTSKVEKRYCRFKLHTKTISWKILDDEWWLLGERDESY